MSAPLDFLFRTAVAAAARLDKSGGLTTTFKLAEAAVDPEGVNLRGLLPAAIVYPLAEDLAGNLGGRAAAVQRVTARLGVLQVISIRNRPGGAGALDRACEPVGEARGLLSNWTPEGADGPMTLNGGALQEIAEGRMYWLDRYQVEWTLDSQRRNGA